MGYYSDEFFKEYDEIYSDSSKRNNRTDDRLRDPRRVSDEDFDGSQRTVRRPQNRRPVSRAPYDNYDRNAYDSDGVYGVGRYNRNVREPDPRRIPPTRDPRDTRRPPLRKKGLTRRTRRTIIVMVFVIIVLLLVTAIAAIAGSAKGPSAVEGFKATEVKANEIVLSWEKAQRADHYIVTMSTGGSDDYEEYQKIDSGDTETLTVTDLQQASLYRFRITAYRGDKAGKVTQTDDIWTLPTAPEITNVFSAKAGTLHVDWSQNDKADGYIVEYHKDGGEYGGDQSLTVSGAAECRADITDLEKDASYTVRVSAFTSKDKQYTSIPSAEQSVKIAAQDTELAPKAMDLETDSSIDPDKPMIALTFDDGPSANGDSSERILDTLEKYHAKASFFMVGYYVSQNPENVKRKAALKMELGNHTWDHTHYGNDVTPDDIRRASNQIYDVCGQFPTCFRSPGGATTSAILTECAAENMSAYYWSIDTEDWKSRDADAVYHAVVDHVKDGDIILMHEIYDSTADAVERMVPELIAQGYQLVTCHDLVALKGGSAPVAGKQYSNAFNMMEI